MTITNALLKLDYVLQSAEGSPKSLLRTRPTGFRHELSLSP